jgi:hypothetical protein
MVAPVSSLLMLRLRSSPRMGEYIVYDRVHHFADTRYVIAYLEAPIMAMPRGESRYLMHFCNNTNIDAQAQHYEHPGSCWHRSWGFCPDRWWTSDWILRSKTPNDVSRLFVIRIQRKGFSRSFVGTPILLPTRAVAGFGKITSQLATASAKATHLSSSTPGTAGYFCPGPDPKKRVQQPGEHDYGVESGAYPCHLCCDVMLTGRLIVLGKEPSIRAI